MDPLSAGILGTMAVGSLVNIYQAEQARGADKKRLNEIRGLFDRIKPPGYDVSIDAPPQYHTEALKQPQYAGALGGPQFDTSRLTPEDLKLVGKYTPELAPYVAQAAPELVKQSAAAMQGREAQKSALQKYMQMGDTGNDAISAQASALAAQRAGADTQSRAQSIMQDFARRGQAGSGLQLAAQLQGSQAAGNQEAMAQMQAAADAQRRRLEALSSGASLGGQIYGQEMNLASQNTGIINDFNQRMANARQNYENQRAQTMNQGQQYNLNMAQDLANQNVMARNAAQKYNLGRSDELAKYGSQFAQQQQSRADQLANQQYQNAFNERNYQNNIAENRAQWNANQRAQYNKYRGQEYDDQIRQAAGMSGAIDQQRQGERQYAQDRAQGVQGLVNAGVAGMSQQQANDQWKKQQMAADDRAFYKNNQDWMDPYERKARSQFYDENY